jgi:predicted Zn-dependent protease
LAATRALEGKYELARAAYADLLANGEGDDAALDTAVYDLESREWMGLEGVLSSLSGPRSNPTYTLLRAHLYLHRERPGDALQLLIDYDAEFGLHPAVVILEASLRFERGEASAALRRLEAVLESWPESTLARRERARILALEDRPAEALEELERLRALGVGPLGDEIALLQLLRRCGEDERAEQLAERLAQLHPLSLRVRSQQRGRWLAPLAVDSGLESMESPALQAEEAPSGA